jgi:class 3 adenylate cyclase/tetratricopeptide (TPR) repeat protein
LREREDVSRESTTVTVLFTNLVGSTELLREGSHAADEIQRAHREAARAAVSGHRGTVVKGVGDGVMAVFASTADAVECAGAIQQAAARARRTDPRHPLVRVGVSAGEATRDGDDWHGRPVIEAARLCTREMCAGDQVLTTGIVPLLLRGSSAHTFEALGPRELKGFDEPVEVFELVWRRAPQSSMPLPAPAVRASETRFVGRADEQARLMQLWSQAEAGSPRVALVAGEPGMGKTRLIAEVVRRAHDEHGATVLWGGCDEELAVSYRPFVDALRGWFVQATDVEARAVLTRGEIVRLIPELEHRFPDLPDPAAGEPDFERLCLFEHVTEIVSTLAANAPLFLVVDDLHWATAPTVLLFRHLVRAASGSLMIVGAYRDTDLDRVHPLAAALADMRRDPFVERIALSGLDRHAITEYIAGTEETHGEDAPALAEALYAETKGNPFFVIQVLQHLAEQSSEAPPREVLALPEGVREVIGRRLSRLSDDANRSLAVAAVVGSEFDLRTIELVAEEDPARVLDGLDDAVGARLIEETADHAGRYAFAHALVRQTLLTELTVARRARLHRQVAQALLQLPEPDPALLAHHFCAGATAGAVDEAVEWSMRAATAAVHRLAFEEDLELLERALQVLELDDHPDVHVKAQLHLQLSRARQGNGDNPGARREAVLAAAGARAAGDPMILAQAARSHVAWGLAGSPDPVSAQLLEEALAAVGEEHLATRAQLIAYAAFYRAVYESRGSEADPQARDAVELAKASGDPWVLLDTLETRGLVLIGSPDIAARAANLQEMEATEALPLPPADRHFLHVAILRERVALELQRGDVGAAQRAADELAEVRGLAQRGDLSPFTLMWSGMFHLMAGRLDDAERTIGELAGDRDINFVNSWAAQYFMLRREQGRTEELEAAIAGAVDASPGLVALRTVHLMARAAAGDPSTRDTLRVLTADDLAAIPPDSAKSAALANLAEVCAALEDHDAATALYDHLLPYTGQLLVVAWGAICIGAADRFLAMLDTVLEHHDRAEELFGRALALEERVEADALTTRTRLWWARSRLARSPSDVEGATALLEVAAATASRLGLAGPAAEIDELRGM